MSRKLHLLVLRYGHFYTAKNKGNKKILKNKIKFISILENCNPGMFGIILTLKEPGGGAESAPLDIFCYISAGCYFFALKLHDFFPSSLALDLRPFFKKSDRGL